MNERLSWPLIVTLLFIGFVLGGCAMLIVQQHPASADTNPAPVCRKHPGFRNCTIPPVIFPGPPASSAPTAAPPLPVALPKTGGGKP